jgi:hypothetical protein
VSSCLTPNHNSNNACTSCTHTPRILHTHRHSVGHSHIGADAVISHFRNFLFGIRVRCKSGAAIACIDQLIHALEAEGPLTAWNRKSKRCHWAKVVCILGRRRGGEVSVCKRRMFESRCLILFVPQGTRLQLGVDGILSGYSPKHRHAWGLLVAGT